MLPPSKSLQAIGFMLAAMACFAGMSVAIRQLSYTMPPMQMVFLRNVLGIAIVVAWQAWLLKGMPRFPTRRPGQHFWRATIGVTSMELWFYALSVMSLTLATALSFTTPIFSTIFAVIFLREQAGIRRWSAVAIGFAGMLVMLRPDLGGIEPNAGFVLASSALMAIVGVLIKTLTRTDSPENIVFYMALFMTPWSAIPAFFHWQDVSWAQWQLVFVIAFLSTVAHLLLARALMRTELVVLMPLDFTRLIFVAIFAYFLFGEVLDGATLLGALIIVASTVYIARREAAKRREIAAPGPTV